MESPYWPQNISNPVDLPPPPLDLPPLKPPPLTRSESHANHDLLPVMDQALIKDKHKFIHNSESLFHHWQQIDAHRLREGDVFAFTDDGLYCSRIIQRARVLKHCGNTLIVGLLSNEDYHPISSVLPAVNWVDLESITRLDSGRRYYVPPLRPLPQLSTSVLSSQSLRFNN